MTSNHISPFRLLTKTYASQILTREEYIKIRAKLLRKLQADGSVSEEDLKNFTSVTNSDVFQEAEAEEVETYSLSDWITIGLGLIAAAVLGFVLYT